MAISEEIALWKQAGYTMLRQRPLSSRKSSISSLSLEFDRSAEQTQRMRQSPIITHPYQKCRSSSCAIRFLLKQLSVMRLSQRSGFHRVDGALQSGSFCHEVPTKSACRVARTRIWDLPGCDLHDRRPLALCP